MSLYHYICSCILFVSAPCAVCVGGESVLPDTVKSDHDLDEVVVTGTRMSTRLSHLPATVDVLDRETLTKDNNVSLLPAITRQVPGVFNTSRGVLGYGVSGGGSGGISIRGLGTGEGRVMVLVDGHPQYSGVYGHSVADSYNTMMAEAVEVVRGPASMIYGSNAMGGVVNIVTRRAVADGVSTAINLGGGSYGTFISEISNSVRYNGFSSNLSAQYNRSDNHRPNMSFEQYGGHVNLGYRLNESWRVFADGDVTHFNASHPGTVMAPMAEVDQWVTRGGVNAGVENSHGDLSGALTVYSNFGRHKLNDGYVIATGIPQTRLFRSRDALTGVALHQSACLFAGNCITLGADWQNIYGRAYYTSRATGEVVDTPNKQSGHRHMNEIAGYLNVRQDISELLTVDAGLRYEWHSVAGGEWVPQGGIVVRTSSVSQLKAMVGKGFRNPTMREMYLYPPSNDELLPECIVNYELSWHHLLFGNRLSYTANIFYLNGDNLIQTVNRQNVNTGKVENWGAEIDVTFRVSGALTLSTNHSWLRMVHPLLAAPQYKGYLGADLRWRSLSANVSLQQVAGLYTILGSKAHTENFTLLGVSARYRLNSAVSLWITGDNLLAQRYEINDGYPMPRATATAGVKLNF